MEDLETVGQHLLKRFDQGSAVDTRWVNDVRRERVLAAGKHPDVQIVDAGYAGHGKHFATDFIDIDAGGTVSFFNMSKYLKFVAKQARLKAMPSFDQVGQTAILATTATNPQGLVDTLAGAKAFGDAGSRSFSTGKFNITAVATFAGPMPYSAADCPVYGRTYGAHCADSDPTHPLPAFPLDVPVPAGVDPLAPPIFAPFPDGQPRGAGPAPADPVPAGPTDPQFPAEAHGASAIVGGADEGHALALLQNEILRGGPGPQDADRPAIATVMMLGPLVRGAEVHVS